ncbi:DUF6166 domain-containing protein [Halorubellus salinus]|uniref:DUF6166 domain-containing protein n=1 Tax=Halorubellus salinus TaxID=755309 RepID=UPI001D05D73F
MTRYHGLGGRNVFVLDKDGERRALNKRPDLLDQPSTQFDWQDGEQGTGHLALALLAHAVDDDTARELHHQFEQDVVAHLPASWSLTREEILAWVALQQEDLEAGEDRGAVA